MLIIQKSHLNQTNCALCMTTWILCCCCCCKELFLHITEKLKLIFFYIEKCAIQVKISNYFILIRAWLSLHLAKHGHRTSVIIPKIWIKKNPVIPFGNFPPNYILFSSVVFRHILNMCKSCFCSLRLLCDRRYVSSYLIEFSYTKVLFLLSRKIMYQKKKIFHQENLPPLSFILIIITHFRNVPKISPNPWNLLNINKNMLN